MNHFPVDVASNLDRAGTAVLGEDLVSDAFNSDVTCPEIALKPVSSAG